MKITLLIIFKVLIILQLTHGATHPHGKGIQLKYGKHFQSSRLKEVLLHSKVKDRKVVVVSIIGPYRKGKSFLLNYCLRYLYANYKSINTMRNNEPVGPNWWGNPEKPLTGFSWAGGSEANTKGIQVWSDVFLYDKPHEKIAIILLDTQGLFELSGDANLDAKIFGITSFLSSILIYNIHDVIQENDLKYLKMINDYSILATKRHGKQKSKPFQQLLLLLRDWSDDDVGYGHLGGAIYLNRTLSTGRSNKVSQGLRASIKDSYDHISMFLLPSPGKNALKNNYDGRWSQLDNDFKLYLKTLIQSILSTDGLVKKKVSGKEVTAAKLYEYATSWFKAFQSSRVPSVSSLVDIIDEAELRELNEKLLKEYKKELKARINGNMPNFLMKMKETHSQVKNKILAKFKKEVKSKSASLGRKYENELTKSMDEFYNEWAIEKEKLYNLEKKIKETQERLEEQKREQERLLEQHQKELEALNTQAQGHINNRQSLCRRGEELVKKCEQKGLPNCHLGLQACQHVPNDMVQNAHQALDFFKPFIDSYLGR